jgi:hypothetical protein
LHEALAEQLLPGWIALNETALIDFWDAKVGYTEDALKLLERI